VKLVPHYDPDEDELCVAHLVTEDERVNAELVHGVPYISLWRDLPDYVLPEDGGAGLSKDPDDYYSSTS
jgi:hypothetical protein